LFSKVLVPVDGSDNSFRALDAALLLSEKLGAKITVIHVMEEIPVSYVVSEKLLREITDSYKRESQDILSKCSDIAKQKGLTTETKLLQGDAGSTILNYSENEKSDIIIMGSRGRGKFKELVLGSVSSKVVHHASCAVMIIR
jgi:nucleotide-binding universal stress UspA family protein